MIYAGIFVSLLPSNAQQEVVTDDCPGNNARQILPEQAIRPYSLDVSFDKTTHIIFPSPIIYVDLGSSLILAAKAGGAENVLRVKAAARDFMAETNLSVITAEGSFYSFNVKYTACPEKLNIEMQQLAARGEGETCRPPNHTAAIYLKGWEGESPARVSFICRSIHKENRRQIRHIESHSFGIRYRLKSIHSHGKLLYVHTEIRNRTNVDFDVDFIRIKIIDKKLAKRTAIQETLIQPLSVWNEVRTIEGRRTERTIFAISKMTLPSDKRLLVELFEKNGGRHQSFTIESADLAAARSIDTLKTAQP
jgi:conjugative transposon TraN protein